MGSWWDKSRDILRPVAGLFVIVFLFISAQVLDLSVSAILPESISVWITGRPWIILLSLGIVWLLWSYYKGLYNWKKEEKNLRDKIDDIINVGIDDLPFGEAIVLIRELSPNFANSSDLDIHNELVRLAHKGKIKAWGEPSRELEMFPRAENKVEIPHEFFFDPNGWTFPDDGYVFEIHNSQPNWADQHNHPKYFNVCVNRAQIIGVLELKEH